MPLAKSAPTPATAPSVQPSTQQPAPTQAISHIEGFEGIPFEVYRFFNVSPSVAKSDDIRQIKEVYRWSAKEEGGIGDTMVKLRNLEMKLGSPGIGETRYSKMYNWIRVSNIVSELETEREKQIERIMKKREIEIKLIKQEKEKKLAELERKKKAEATLIRKSREAELRQFKRLRQAYE